MKKVYSLVLCTLLLFTFNLLIVDAASDATPPVIEEVKILTPVVKPGSKVKIQVKVSDDVSGTKDVSFLFRSPSDNNHFMPVLYINEYDKLSNTYTFESAEISRYAENGNWSLQMMTANDYAGNVSRMYSHIDTDNIKDLFFTVDSNAPDVDVDEEIDVNDGFTAWESKNNVELNKEFTITFNADVDIKTILEKNIYIKDYNGSNVPLMFIIDRDTDLQSSKVTIAPVGSYKPGSTYTLYIKDVISKNGKTLNKNVKMRFSTIK